MLGSAEQNVPLSACAAAGARISAAETARAGMVMFISATGWRSAYSQRAIEREPPRESRSWPSLKGF
jgi:hypothetical protein